MTSSRHDLPSAEAGTLPAVRPFVILAACVFGGVWLGWPWFLLNAFALDLENKAKLAKRMVLGLVGASVISIAILAVAEPDAMDPSLLGLLLDDPEPHEFSWVPYMLIALVGWKTAFAYLLFEDQRLPSEVYEYYGGVMRNGIPVVAAGSFLRSWILLQLLPVGWWTLVLA